MTAAGENAYPSDEIPIVTSQVTSLSAGGVSTLSITWITPLLAGTSASVTIATPSPTITPKTSLTYTNSKSPLAVVTFDFPSVRSADIISPGTTWYSKMFARVSFPSGVSSAAKSIPAAANASSVGANSVNGPSL